MLYPSPSFFCGVFLPYFHVVFSVLFDVFLGFFFKFVWLEISRGVPFLQSFLESKYAGVVSEYFFIHFEQAGVTSLTAHRTLFFRVSSFTQL